MSENEESSVTFDVRYDQTVNGDSTYSYATSSQFSTDMYPGFSGYGWDFIRVLQLTIIIVGTIANICLIVLLVKDKEKKTSATLYLGAIAVNDTVYMLAVFLVYYWLYDLINFSVETTSSFGCKITLTLDATTDTLSAWLVITLITERLIYLYFPRITKLFSRRVTGMSVIIMLLFIAFIVNCHYILWYEVISFRSETDNTTFYYCVAARLQLLEYVAIYEEYIFSILCGLCPVVCILIGNIFFAKALYRSVWNTERNGHGNVNEGKDRDLLVCTMVISILFLILDVPLTADNTFNLFQSDTFILMTMSLIYRSIKLFVYILYKRSFRLYCIKKHIRAIDIASNP